MDISAVASLIKEICVGIIGVVDKHISSGSYNLRPGFFQSKPVEHERDGSQLDWSSDDEPCDEPDTSVQPPAYEELNEGYCGPKEELLGAPPDGPCGCSESKPGFLETATPGFLTDAPVINVEKGICQYCGRLRAECECTDCCPYCGVEDCYGDCEQY